MHLAVLKSFANLTAADVQTLEGLSEVRDVDKSWRLCTAGDPHRFIGLVLAGLFKTHAVDSEGNPHIAAFSETGHFISDYAAHVSNLPARFSIEAIEPSRLMIMEIDAFEKLRTTPGPWFELSYRILEKTFLELAKREHQFLTLSARERYLEFCKDRPQLLDRITQKDIAAYLGITPVSLSRLVASLRVGS